MRQYLIAILLFVAPLAGVKAQNDAVNEIRREVYQRVLALTPEEAQKFWPVFDRMNAERDAVKKELRTQRQQLVLKYKTMTEADADRIIQKMMELQQKELDIQKKYYEEFKKAISVKKIALMVRAEREFKRELLNRLKDYREEE